jgi:hypothetical protein
MNVFPTLNSLGMTVQLPFTPTFSCLSSVSELQAGARQSYTWRPNPLMSWDLSYAALTVAEYNTLLAFQQAQQGRYGEFVFLDPGGNLIPASQNFSDASWQTSGITVGSAVADPFGGTAATTVTGATNGQMAAQVLPSIGGTGFAGFFVCISLYVKAPTNSSLVLGFLSGTSGFSSVIASQSFALPANVWTRLSFATQLASNVAVRAMIGGSDTWTGALAIFGAQVVPLGGAGAYQATPGNYGYHSKVRFDTDLLEPQYVGPNQVSLKCRLVEHS